jgi:hypothetical protein
MSTSKKKASLLDEYKKAKFADSQKDIRSSLLKIRDQLADSPFLVEIVEIDVILNNGFTKEAYERSQILVDAMTKATDTSIDFKEMKNISHYFLCQTALDLKTEDDTCKILQSLKDEPTTEEVATALRSIFSGLYIEIRGLIGKSLLKAKDYKNAATTMSEFSSQVKNFKQVIDSLDSKTLLRILKLLIVIPQISYEQGEYVESLTKLRELLELAKTLKAHVKFPLLIQRELAKVLARAPLPENTPTMNFPRNPFEESVKILFSLMQDSNFDETAIDDGILLFL